MSRAKDRTPGKVIGHKDRQLLSDVATKTYVDGHIQALQTGVLKHGVTAIQNAPPTGTVAHGSLYIIGKNPTGAWAGLANNVAMAIPDFSGVATHSWGTIPPVNKEERLVEAEGKIYQYQAATQSWEELAVSVASGSSTTFAYQNNVSHFDIVKPAGAVEVLDATLDIWLIAESGLSFPSVEFLGFAPFQLEDARWRSDTYSNSSYATDSATKAYVNTNNVTGNIIKVGFIGGGTGHQWAASCMSSIKIRARKIHGTKLHFTAEVNAARKADDFPTHHYFSGIIGQPFASLTGMRVSVAGNAFTVDAEMRGE